VVDLPVYLVDGAVDITLPGVRDVPLSSLRGGLGNEGSEVSPLRAVPEPSVGAGAKASTWMSSTFGTHSLGSGTPARQSLRWVRFGSMSTKLRMPTLS
jgi:hypothetical protein